MKKYKIKRKDLSLVIEAIKYIQTDARGRRVMLEACGDMYPEVHTDEDGRMMDYGHVKSDSHEGRMTKAKLLVWELEGVGWVGNTLKFRHVASVEDFQGRSWVRPGVIFWSSGPKLKF